ncbi:MAG: isopentenyl-diphosphate Delta-isomerase [Candidatus Woesebacteria bacterium]
MDQVILVDADDKEIGVMDKVEAHRGTGKLHRATSVFLFNKKGELLVQQRSSKKITCQLMWANTCCGNLRPGETYRECAHRRLQEELGIFGVKLEEVVKFLYQTPCDDEFSEYEMDTVYMGYYDGQVRPNPDEVSGYKWIEWNDLMLQNSLVPWVKIMKQKEIIKKIKEHYDGIR